MQKALAVSAFLWAAGHGASASPEATFTAGTTFSATDPRDLIQFRLGRDLVIRAHREVSAQGTHLGWWLEAVDTRAPKSPNFLYECLCGHGPHPADLLAWHLQQPEAVANLGPLGERLLPVWGYPYLLRVECVACEAAGQGMETRFTAGTVSVEWRRLRESNPRQRTPTQPGP